MTFLLDALKTFQLEGWTDLERSTLKDIADCYRKLPGEKEKLVRVCAQIACFKNEDLEERKSYFEEMMQTLQDHVGELGFSKHLRKRHDGMSVCKCDLGSV